MRKENWDVEFNKYINTLNTKEYKYGSYDCCIFAADAVKAITGIDYMEEFRGKYNSVEEGNEALKTIGKGSLYRTLRAKFGKPVRGCYGRKGDVAFYDDCCGIVLGRSALFIGINGQVLVPLRKVQRVFLVD
jgi:hypothetical protein